MLQEKESKHSIQMAQLVISVYNILKIYLYLTKRRAIFKYMTCAQDVTVVRDHNFILVGEKKAYNT